MKTAEEILDGLIHHDGIGSPEDVKCFVAQAGYKLELLVDDHSPKVRWCVLQAAHKQGQEKLLKKLKKDEDYYVNKMATFYLNVRKKT